MEILTVFVSTCPYFCSNIRGCNSFRKILPTSRNHGSIPHITSFLYEAGLIPLRRSSPNRRQCLTLWQKRTSMKRSKKGDGGTGVYMRERTTSRVMAADWPYGEFYDSYSVSPECSGYHHVFYSLIRWHRRRKDRRYETICSQHSSKQPVLVAARSKS
jgi:hypothetical protein